MKIPAIDYNKAAGQALRHFRRRRKQTLVRAAVALSTSAPVLSRKERGKETIEREDIRRAIVAYNLSPWEAYELWTAAGFIPEPAIEPIHTYDLRAFAETLLPDLPFPAFILDILGFIRAWNEEIEAIWTPSQSAETRIHIIGELFTARVREHMGLRWEPYILQALKVFYHKTLRVANDPVFQALLHEFPARYGDEFVRLWNAAHSNNGSWMPLALGGTVVSYGSPYGLIDYLAMQATFQFPHEYELIMYIPFGPESQVRYQQFKAGIGPKRLYFRT